MIRLSCALGIFLSMICWETLKPRRALVYSRWQRWPINLGLALLNMLVVRLSLGSIAYLSAVTAQQLGWGLLNITHLPTALDICITLVLLDLAIYGQHIALHKFTWLWRLHQIHHTDLEFDATTAVRFHPFEIILSLLFKVICIIIIGANPAGVIAFEILLNGFATFNHSNIRIPDRLDHALRFILVTPDMHRIHHSSLPAETDSNYGFSISSWDRLFRTYTVNPAIKHTQMQIGLKSYRDPKQLSLLKLLSMPFKSKRHK